MSELLAIANNNSVMAVMRQRDAFRLSSTTSHDGHQELLTQIPILVFASRRTIRRWHLAGDVRAAGMAGSEEDLNAILQKRNWGWGEFFVPFSNGPRAAVSELEHHAPTWEKFQYVFGRGVWTFKFGQIPDWLSVNITDPDFIGRERHEEIW